VAEVLDQPGWYVNFRSPAESFIVSRARSSATPGGDAAGRAAAQARGRQRGIPEPQLDRTV